MSDVAIAENPPLARDIVPTDRRLLPAPLEQIQEVGALIQSAGAFVNKDLRQDPGACVAVAYMAALHGTDPIMTASKAFLVNGRLAFEAQFISALVRQHIDEPFDITFQGAGAQRFCIVKGKVKGKDLLYQSPIIGQIKVKNSALWHTDPDQQLGAYYSVRAWARRHMPGVLLGVYAVEELQQITVRDVSPTVNRFDDSDIDDLPEAEVTTDEQETFEPSGGFVAAEQADAPAVEQEEPAEDPQEWFETMKGRVDDAEDRPALDALWRTTRTNHKRLADEDKAGASDLTERFKARGKAL